MTATYLADLRATPINGKRLSISISIKEVWAKKTILNIAASEFLQ